MRDSTNLWIQGARPKTLPAAIAPVVVGSACAHLESSMQNNWLNSVFALIVSLALQVAVNFANDYSDGIRGTDKDRVGPLRLVGSGAKKPADVKKATFLAFGVAAVFGFVLAATTSWWLLLVGVLCFLAGWFYTGGKHPYGYLGFGEVFVFIFFGVVATMGTTFVINQQLTLVSFLASVVVGCLACALLAVNNLRDIAGDATSNKRTLAVRIGESGARKFYILLFIVAGCAVVSIALLHPAAMIAMLGLAVAIKPIRRVYSGATGADLINVLVMTGRVQILVAIALSVGLLFS
ncbi:MAG: 1,4-dihydroxy-2-naphthoate polyprenyltransferase [Ilumatobacteraceae bacterium]|nr:MAG: 1,4-dihydroxy-2-naphthoate octaprenyltransferase [Acidimicrobium sp. BACL27 MAG-120823-bin4]MDP4735392.1 1,4-dihydroxy-2-naphthoate polyprenyltransferase [Ilumatobacteraceae bacterium]